MKIKACWGGPKLLGELFMYKVGSVAKKTGRPPCSTYTVMDVIHVKETVP